MLFLTIFDGSFLSLEEIIKFLFLMILFENSRPEILFQLSLLFLNLKHLS